MAQLLNYIKNGWRQVGYYPKEYNPRVHGPYAKARYYGKPDIKLTDVQLKDLPAWLMRRNKDPISMVRCTGRAFHRFMDKYVRVIKGGGMIPSFFFVMTVFPLVYLTYRDRYYAHQRHTRYH